MFQRFQSTIADKPLKRTVIELDEGKVSNFNVTSTYHLPIAAK